MKISTSYRLLVALCFLVLVALILRALRDEPRSMFRGPARIVDGDTLVIDDERLRLRGIDAPEIHQVCHQPGGDWFCGLSARDQLEKLARGDGLKCLSKRRDKYRRPLVDCSRSGLDINREMVVTGMAVDYGAFKAEATQAAQEKLGIWDSDFERPEIWRKRHAGLGPDTSSDLGALDMVRGAAGSVLESLGIGCGWCGTPEAESANP